MSHYERPNKSPRLLSKHCLGSFHSCGLVRLRGGGLWLIFMLLTHRSLLKQATALGFSELFNFYYTYYTAFNLATPSVRKMNMTPFGVGSVKGV